MNQQIEEAMLEILVGLSEQPFNNGKIDPREELYLTCLDAEEKKGYNTDIYYEILDEINEYRRNKELCFI